MSQKNIVYLGLGFPVLIEGVETFIFRGEELPKVNHNKLNEQIFEALMVSRSRLTGNQLSFIRGHMNLSQVEFAKSLGFELYSTISAWFEKGDEGTGMTPATELAVRMLMAHFVNRFDEVNQNAPLILAEIEEAKPELHLAA